MHDTVATACPRYHGACLADIFTVDQTGEVRPSSIWRRWWFVGYDSMNYEVGICPKTATIEDHFHLRMILPNRGKTLPWYTIARKGEGKGNRFTAG